MSRERSTMRTLWGETKTLREWYRDPRSQCLVYTTLEARVKAGWDLERALTSPPRVYTSTMCEAFGEEKSLRRWSMDHRCVVPYNTLYTRYKVGGWPLEAALVTRQHGKPESFYTDPDES